jgi:tRNA modification GTPase
MADADLVLLVVDATAPPHPEDEATIASLTDRPLLIARNKSDLARGGAGAHAEHTTIATSAITGEGVGELRAAILSRISAGGPVGESALITNLRQQHAIADALAAIRRAHVAATAEIPHEMILIDLHEALRSLDSLTGATTADDILNLIFSRFCIGK